MTIQDQQKIPPGYKMTEVGVIPQDRDFSELGKLANYKNGKGYEKYITDQGIYSLITLNSISIEGKLKNTHTLIGFDDHSLDEGDLIMVLSDVAHGYFLGLTVVIPESGKYVLNQRMGALKNIKKMIPSYLSALINFNQKYFKIAGQGSSQQNLNKGDIMSFLVKIPPISEQQSISTALTDIDNLISELDTLIIKKQAIKQGTMQQLLTGKKRLPGFSEKWEERSLGEILDYEQPTKYLVKNTEYNENNGVPVLTAGKTFILGYTVEEEGIYTQFPVIIFDDFTTANKYVTFPFKAKSSAMKMLKLRNKTNNLRFIFEKIQMIEFPLGDHKRYWISEYQHIKINLPTSQEQQAIASFLSDMDNDIQNTITQRDKYKLLKQGMMQQLLTGKIRLKTTA